MGAQTSTTTTSYEFGDGNVEKKRKICNGRNAICVLEPKNSIHGIVEFHQCSEYEPVHVSIKMVGRGFKTHAIHIHEYGDTRNGCVSLGPHFNPYQQTHGSLQYNMPRHAGDLINNITFNVNGYFNYDYYDDLLTLFSPDGKDISFIGRSIVIHERPDDLGLGNNKESLITGNAGNRINCAVIGVCETKHF